MRLVLSEPDTGVWLQLEGESAGEWARLEALAASGISTCGPGTNNVLLRLRALAEEGRGRIWGRPGRVPARVAGGGGGTVRRKEGKLDNRRQASLRSVHDPRSARRFTMGKILRCNALMPFCKAVLNGKDVAEVVEKAVEHAKQDHGMVTVPPDFAAKAEAAIKDE
jgi:predicted small metal-binding protein